MGWQEYVNNKLIIPEDKEKESGEWIRYNVRLEVEFFVFFFVEKEYQEREELIYLDKKEWIKSQLNVKSFLKLLREILIVSNAQ